MTKAKVIMGIGLAVVGAAACTGIQWVIRRQMYINEIKQIRENYAIYLIKKLDETHNGDKTQVIAEVKEYLKEIKATKDKFHYKLYLKAFCKVLNVEPKVLEDKESS